MSDIGVVVDISAGCISYMHGQHNATDMTGKKTSTGSGFPSKRS